MYCTVLYCTVLYCTISCSVLYCTVLYPVLYCSVLYCFCSILFCTDVYCCVLYCSVLHGSVRFPVQYIYAVLYCFLHKLFFTSSQQTVRWRWRFACKQSIYDKGLCIHLVKYKLSPKLRNVLLHVIVRVPIYDFMSRNSIKCFQKQKHAS